MKKLSQKVVRLLTKKKFKISFAESCTGGLLSSTIFNYSLRHIMNGIHGL